MKHFVLIQQSDKTMFEKELNDFVNRGYAPFDNVVMVSNNGILYYIILVGKIC